MILGKSAIRKEGKSKVLGQAKYVDDLSFPQMLLGKTIRSTVPRAKIRKIHFAQDFSWKEMVVVSADDIPGKNIVTLITEDQPFLAKSEVHHFGEAILLIAHQDPEVLIQAEKSITIDYEILPSCHDIDSSLAKNPLIWGSDNLFKSYHLKKGDVVTAFKNASFIIEGEYQTGAQEQLYIENQGMIATYDEVEGVTVWGSMQCPYYIHKALVPLFHLPHEKVRIIQTETGGGFGGKEEYPSILAGHAALLAMKAKRPVKMIYSRAEDMAVTTKRHPSRSIIKTAHDQQGKLLAVDFDFVIDGGAYATLSAVVLSRGTIHAVGPYQVEHVSVQARACATNTPPHGAFRGFGAPQSIFAMERHLDRAAKKIGITPEEMRLKNFIVSGSRTATNQLISEKINFQKLLKNVLGKMDYHQKLKDFDQQNKNSMIKKGIGFATFMHGAGFTGSGEKYLQSIVGLEVLPKGVVRVLAGSTEIGQGTNTIFGQIVAENLKIPYEQVEVARPDTKNVPNSGPTVASRTVMIVGDLLARACADLLTLLKNTVGISNNDAVTFFSSCESYLKQFGSLKVFVQYQQPSHITWDDKNYIGDAYATYAWAVYGAEVSINTLTYEVKVDDFVALQEVGKVLNPTLAMGQIEGGVAQGIGFALSEKCLYEKGQMINNQMTNYIMLTSADVPPIRVFFTEENFDYGPSGAKGIGELPMDGPAPAIMNAVNHALGSDLNFVPCLPEDIFQTITTKNFKDRA
jgi:CO/xanthine dehydrogenase Mo-binding subunit